MLIVIQQQKSLQDEDISTLCSVFYMLMTEGPK